MHEGDGKGGGGAKKRPNTEPTCTVLPTLPRTNPTRVGATVADMAKTDLCHKQHTSWEGREKLQGQALSKLRGRIHQQEEQLARAATEINMLKAAAASAASAAPAPVPVPTPDLSPAPGPGPDPDPDPAPPLIPSHIGVLLPGNVKLGV